MIKNLSVFIILFGINYVESGQTSSLVPHTMHNDGLYKFIGKCYPSESSAIMWLCTDKNELILQRFEDATCQNAGEFKIEENFEYNCESVPENKVVSLREQKMYEMDCNNNVDFGSRSFKCENKDTLLVEFFNKKDCVDKRSYTKFDHTNHESVYLFNCGNGIPRAADFKKDTPRADADKNGAANTGDDHTSDAGTILGHGWAVLIVGFICLLFA